MDNLQYWYGLDYKITDRLSIKHPKLIEIMEIGQDRYSEYVSVLTLSTIHVADILYEKLNVWYEDITDWELFINNFIVENNSNDENKIIKKSLLFFTGLDFEPMKDKQDNIVLYNKENDIILNEFSFNIMRQFIKEINYIVDADIYYQLKRAGSKGTAKYILKQISKQRNIKNKNNVDLQSICSSLMWKSGIGEEIFNYPIYRIHEGYARLNAIDNWDKTMTAYYSGNIDTEKAKINFEKINWSKILK